VKECKNLVRYGGGIAVNEFKAKSLRQTNFELLRIIAMLMMVISHYMWYAGLLLELNDTINGRYIFIMAIRSLTVGCLNLFVMLTGYFMVKASFQFKRFFRLLCQVLFYSLLIPAVLSLLGLPTIAKEDGFYGVLTYFLPVSTGHYWFITAYVSLYLICPFLNAAFEEMPKRQLGKIIIILLVLFCGVKSFVPIELSMDDGGRGIIWFICLYLTGAYIRTYGLPMLNKKAIGWVLYFSAAILVFLWKIASYYIYRETDLLKRFFEIPYDSNFILDYLMAIGLFAAFARCEIKEGRAASFIRWAAPLVLGVYLLHVHADIWHNWYYWTQLLFGRLWNFGFIGMIINMVVTVLFVFMIGIAVDALRRAIFDAVEKKLLGKGSADKGEKG
jgi:surface polysaccharide O-acyltransferase-like enzyme